MDAFEEVIFEDYFYKYSDKKHKIFIGRKGKWKQKYFVLKKCGEKPVLQFFNKKPKSKTIPPKGQCILWPTFRVEKSINSKNRQIIFEITTQEQQLCLSSDSKKEVDMFVFLLQIQSKLKPQIQDDIFHIEAENCDASKGIGSHGANCILHVSPCGITVALQESRSVLAQWPLKSIRCFESSGFGQLTLEAGRVAPMGEGIYNFLTRDGEDNKIYDILDQYIVDTLDRAKPHRKGTSEEIADYLEEFDKLHSLTQVSATSMTSPDILVILKDNYEYIPPGDDEIDIVDGDVAIVRRKKTVVHSRVQTASIHVGNRQSQYNPKTIPPVTIPNPPFMVVANGNHDQDKQHIVTTRPPPPPPRPGSGSRGTNGSRQHRSKQRRSSSLSSSNSQEHNGSTQYLQLQGDKSANISISGLPAPDDLNDSPSPSLKAQSTYLESNTHSTYYEGTQTTGRVKSSLEKRRKAENVDNESLKATSCEDLSSHMKNVLFPGDSVDSLDDLVNQPDENMNSAKPPMPFPKLQAFRASDDFDKPDRDRSKSIDYCNARFSCSTRSPSPSARHIRRLLSNKKQSHETLRKSNSNPNFLNVGSKQSLYSQANGVRSPTQGSPTLSPKNKHASRSLASLLPVNLRRALSREKVKGDGVERNSHWHSKSNTPTHSRSNSLDKFSKRKRSNSIRGPNIKDINFSERTRSFRKIKSRTDNDGLVSIKPEEKSVTHATNCHVVTESKIKDKSELSGNSFRESGRRKNNPAYNHLQHVISLPSHQREETRC